jgi:hypothetical protein
MPNEKRPRFHDAWRKSGADREEDAASLFGYYLLSIAGKRRSGSSSLRRSFLVPSSSRPLIPRYTT